MESNLAFNLMNIYIYLQNISSFGLMWLTYNNLITILCLLNRIVSGYVDRKSPLATSCTVTGLFVDFRNMIFDIEYIDAKQYH